MLFCITSSISMDGLSDVSGKEKTSIFFGITFTGESFTARLEMSVK